MKAIIPHILFLHNKLFMLSMKAIYRQQHWLLTSSSYYDTLSV